MNRIYKRAGLKLLIIIISLPIIQSYGQNGSTNKPNETPNNNTENPSNDDQNNDQIQLNSTSGFSLEDKFPLMMTPSPKASSIDKFGVYPVNLFTGLVDITIPIYTINVNGISIPIEFKYHASGLKYDDLPMELGLGWSLIAGGIISHTPMGSSDFKDVTTRFWVKDVNDINPEGNGFQNSDNGYMGMIADGNNLDYSGASGTADGEHDIYNYSFPGGSGQFFFPESGFYNPKFIPAKPYQFSRSHSVQESLMTIIDENGISYIFKLYESDYYQGNNTYYLEKIISADKSDTIVFTYRKFSLIDSYQLSRPYINSTFTTYDIEYTRFLNRPIYAEYKGGLNYKKFAPPVLTNIVFRGGEVSFTYDAVSQHSLKTIVVKNNLGQTIKNVTLEKTNHQMLNKVLFNGTSSYSYSFEYNGTPPTSGGIDYWGYYNGKTGGSAQYVPNFSINTQSYSGNKIPGMDRSVNELITKQGILTKIVYPTKGYSTFDYESHKINAGMLYGGLRIKEIRNYDTDGILLERKWYKYGANESGNGKPAIFVNESDFFRKTRIIEGYEDEYTAHTLGRVISMTTYFTFPRRNYFMSGSSVVYTDVTEYTGNASGYSGKTLYQFYYQQDEYETMGESGYLADHPKRSYSWKNGLLRFKTVYNNNSNIIYSLSNYYKDLSSGEYLNLSVRPYIQFESCMDVRYNFSVSSNPYSAYIGNSLYEYYNYYNCTGLSVLDYSTETKDGVTTRTDYKTYNSYGMPTETQQSTSTGTTKVTKYKYPSDYSGNSIYSNMIAKNILSPVIEQNEYAGSSFLTRATTPYANKYGNSNLYVPEQIEMQTGKQSSGEIRVQYHKYDNYGNPIYMTKDGFTNIVYIWGYNGLYPIAEIKNATYAQVTQIISESSLSSIATKSEPSASDWTTLKTLQSNDKFHVTLNKYKPLVGIIESIDPKGYSTVYEYDAMNRLQTVSFMDGTTKRVIESYNYNYRTN